MVAVRMVKVTLDEIVDVVAMRDRLVTAARPMDVTFAMTSALMVRRTLLRVRIRHGNSVIVVVIAVRVVQVAVMKKVDMALVLNRHVAAILPMNVNMPMFASAFHLSFLPSPKIVLS